MSKTPLSLTVLARMAVNSAIETHSDIHSLDIPVSLRNELHSNYLSDKISCTEDMWNDELIDACQALRFEEHFEDVGVDCYLQLRNWPLIMPEFCYEDNCVSYRWFEYELDNVRRCYECAFLLRTVVHEYCTHVRVPAVLIAEEVIHTDEAWCGVCHTVALFRFVDIDEWGRVDNLVRRIHTFTPIVRDERQLVRRVSLRGYIEDYVREGRRLRRLNPY
uniref:Nonstructural protein n=1 Tax=Luscinia sibilans ambidensovirus TaxID=2794457 RepID=A0A8A4XDY1_9VIRU|nr:MAG: nonstructural protein [Luscinia sibilans ambidensovirus]